MTHVTSNQAISMPVADVLIRTRESFALFSVIYFP